jgi:hypothetical protein
MCLTMAQVNHLLELDVAGEQAPKYSAIEKWAQQLQSLHGAVVAKLAV